MHRSLYMPFRGRSVASCLLIAALAGPIDMRAARLETPGPLHTPQIVGMWRWTDTTECTESYEYRSDGSGQVVSGNETTDMHYVLSRVPVADDFFELSVTIRRNSGGRDCLGQNADDAGETYHVYLRFDPGEDSHLVCYRPDVTQCFGPLQRQAPKRD